MKIIDTHQHLWDFDLFPYRWCRDFPVLDRSFRLKDYLEASAGCGVERTVFIECDVDDPHQLDEARQVQRLADTTPLIGGIVASCRPERDGFEAHLETLAKLPNVKGVRRVLHTVPDATSQSERFAANLRLLPAYGLSFDLCAAARQLPLALNLVARCPGVNFILDHGGVPDIKAKAFDPWREHIAALAAHPNVVCKISGLVAYTGTDAWTVDDLRPWAAHVIERFGWDRVLWGSDWPVCTLASTYRRWLDAARELVAGAGPAQQESLFARNARRVYRLD